jgi:hypothetical protein
MQIMRAKTYKFDNSIELVTNKGSIKFASFLNRDSTLNQMHNIKGLDAGVFPKDEEIIADINTIATNDTEIRSAPLI